MVAETLTATRETVHKGAVSLPDQQVFLAREIETLIVVLRNEGYSVFGPTLRDGAIVYGPVQRTEDLPQGWTDEQSPATYRTKRGNDDAYFGYSLGPQSWKKYLHPAELKVFSAERQGNTFRILNNVRTKEETPHAFLGVRACELAAIRLQDRVFLEDRYRDPVYESRRAEAFLIAVQCTRASATCFCSSMGTGPAVSSSVDLVLTELLGPEGHRFLVRAESNRGRDVLQKLKTSPARKADLDHAQEGLKVAESGQVRRLDQPGLRELLYENFEHVHWDSVAAKCLSCANCTMVCPTCFCTTVEDVSDVTGQRAERWRKWDSCFTQTFSYIHGGSIRNSTKARYRQWITHKLASWHDQFGSSGCVGCGRCITWCPAGIDITEEVRAFRGGGDNGDS